MLFLKNEKSQKDIFCLFNYYHTRKKQFMSLRHLKYELKVLSIPIWMSWLEVLNLLTQSCSCLCQEISCQNWGQFDQETGLSDITKSSKKKGSLTHDCTQVFMKSNLNSFFPFIIIAEVFYYINYVNVNYSVKNCWL